MTLSFGFYISRGMNSSGHVHRHHHHHHHHSRRMPTATELQTSIKIKNLPLRSSDTSLKDGLYHEYKKFGKLCWVRVIGVGADRYAIACFKTSEHALRAVGTSQDKMFFGSKIQVTPCFSPDGEEVASGFEDDSRLVIVRLGIYVGLHLFMVVVYSKHAFFTAQEY